MKCKYLLLLLECICIQALECLSLPFFIDLFPLPTAGLGSLAKTTLSDTTVLAAPEQQGVSALCHCRIVHLSPKVLLLALSLPNTGWVGLFLGTGVTFSDSGNFGQPGPAAMLQSIFNGSLCIQHPYNIIILEPRIGCHWNSGFICLQLFPWLTPLPPEHSNTPSSGVRVITASHVSIFSCQFWFLPTALLLMWTALAQTVWLTQPPFQGYRTAAYWQYLDLSLPFTSKLIHDHVRRNKKRMNSIDSNSTLKHLDYKSVVKEEGKSDLNSQIFNYSTCPKKTPKQNKNEKDIFSRVL